MVLKFNLTNYIEHITEYSFSSGSETPPAMEPKKDVSTMTDIGSDYFDEYFANFVQTRPKTGYLEPFEVIWKDVTYKVANGTKTILNGISGSFKSGQIMAVMGPSGAGKSSFLGCLSGQTRKGLTGSITISTERKVR